jgi:hypothetical protein
MTTSNPFQNLRFARASRIPARPIFIAVSLLLFALLWWLVPPAVLFWLLLMLLAVVLWVASYGWRDANRALQALLRRLEQA